MSMQGGGPHPDPFTLSDAGRGRLGSRRRRVTIIQRRTPDAWTEWQRFGDDHSANVALDAAIAAGEPPTDLRLATVPRSRVMTLVAIAALVLFFIAAAAVLSVVVFAS